MIDIIIYTVEAMFVFMVITIINLFQIHKQMREYVRYQRLPWILYLIACFVMIILIVYWIIFGLILQNSFDTIVQYALYSFIPLFVTTGFLTEALKPDWRKTKIAWWIYVIIIIFIIGYCLLTYRLDHNGVYGDDLDTMLFLAGAFVLPAFASLLALTKAIESSNRKIYGLFAFGYFCMVFAAILTILTRGLTSPLLYMCFAMFFVFTWIGTLIKLKELKTSAQSVIGKDLSCNNVHPIDGNNTTQA